MSAIHVACVLRSQKKFLSVALFVTLLFDTVLYILLCNEIIIFNVFKIAQSVQGLFTAMMTEAECCGGVLTLSYPVLCCGVALSLGLKGPWHEAGWAVQQ